MSEIFAAGLLPALSRAERRLTGVCASSDCVTGGCSGVIGAPDPRNPAACPEAALLLLGLEWQQVCSCSDTCPGPAAPLTEASARAPTLQEHTGTRLWSEAARMDAVPRAAAWT